MDPSYVQFITGLMNDDGYELPSGRRPSLGGYPGFSDDFFSENPDLVRDRALSFSRDRGFSWDAGFEDLDNSEKKESGYTIQDIIQSIGRKRTMSGDVNFNFIPMPVDSYEPFGASGPSEVGLPALPSDRRHSFDLQPPIPNRSNIEPNYLNMMPGAHPDMLRANPMAMQHFGIDPSHMHGVGMQLLRPLIPNMGLSMPSPFDEGSIRVGAYTKEERQIRIAKFRAKKNRRVWKKQIKYDCRKKLADNRPRIKGRFVTRTDDDENQDDHDQDADQDGDEADDSEAQHVSQNVVLEHVLFQTCSSPEETPNSVKIEDLPVKLEENVLKSESTDVV